MPLVSAKDPELLAESAGGESFVLLAVWLYGGRTGDECQHPETTSSQSEHERKCLRIYHLILVGA